MRLYEHEGKEIFEEFGIGIPNNRVLTDSNELGEILEEIGLPVVIKAQILSGGRGKAGGVKIADTSDEAHEIVNDILGSELKGEEVKTLLIEEKLDIEKELYFGIIGDDENGKPRMMISSEGGVNIEKIAEETPEKIVSECVSPIEPFEEYQARNFVRKIGLSGKQLLASANILTHLFNVFKNRDAKVVEINPLVLTEQGEFYAVDSKIEVDDHSLSRHKELEKVRGRHLTDPLEREGMEAGVNFVNLDGNIAVLANGAGLAMALMDSLEDMGGKPAAFLDTGGGLSKERMKNALSILLKKAEKDSKVESILFTIRLMISPPDAMAEGMLEALEEHPDSEVPIIGTIRGREHYVEKGQELLADSRITLTSSVEEGIETALKKRRG